MRRDFAPTQMVLTFSLLEAQLLGFRGLDVLEWRELIWQSARTRLLTCLTNLMLTLPNRKVCRLPPKLQQSLPPFPIPTTHLLIHQLIRWRFHHNLVPNCQRPHHLGLARILFLVRRFVHGAKRREKLAGFSGLDFCGGVDGDLG